MIRYMVDGQKLLSMDKWTPVAGTAGAYTLHFTFSDDWAGLTRHAVFKSGSTEIAAIINSDSKCIVPWEVLENPGWLSVGVYGAKSGVRYPTIWEHQRQIMPGPDDGTEGTEPTDTLWQQFVDAVAEDAEKAAEAKTAAAASATASAESAAAAEESAEDAEDAATAAASSATAAGASASAAEQYASHASDSEQRSADNAQSAASSATAAAASEQNAADYAREAEAGARAAVSSAKEAAANAEAAKAVWRPSVSDSGVISWTKSDETTAPESQDIRGPRGEDADPALGISGASVGQTVQISAVDGSGKPTAWTAVDAPSGGGGTATAPVQSVNGKTGAVMLNASDVGADAAGTASNAVAAHNSSSSAHQDIRDAIPTIPAAIKNPNALTFTGAASGTYDGSAAKTVNIPAVPASLKNPNALTFTGGATGSYDGSAAKTVNIPTALKNPNALTFTGAATGSYDGSSAKTIAIPDGIPPSTVSDAGKFLRVGEDGSAAWMTVANAEEASF